MFIVEYDLTNGVQKSDQKRSICSDGGSCLGSKTTVICWPRSGVIKCVILWLFTFQASQDCLIELFGDYVNKINTTEIKTTNNSLQDLLSYRHPTYGYK